MKRILFLIFSLFVLCEQTSAQRQLPEQCSIQITSGAVGGSDFKEAFYVGAAFLKYTKNGNSWIFGCEYLQKRYEYRNARIPFAQITAECGYYTSVFSSANKAFFLSVGVSVLSGYETSNWGEKTLFDGATIIDEDCFIYGGAITFEAEMFVCDRIAFFVNARQRALWNSNIGTFRTQFGVGIKLIIN